MWGVVLTGKLYRGHYHNIISCAELPSAVFFRTEPTTSAICRGGEVRTATRALQTRRTPHPQYTKSAFNSDRPHRHYSTQIRASLSLEIRGLPKSRSRKPPPFLLCGQLQTVRRGKPSYLFLLAETYVFKWYHCARVLDFYEYAFFKCINTFHLYQSR